jgi:hypothetical protein
MARPAIELAAIVRQHGARYQATHALSRSQLRVMRAIAVCRTAALGGHVEGCPRCHHRQIAYNSCRNRHCPKCQNRQRALWLEARHAELLPTAYFHVVFTVPEAVASLALFHARVVYHILFRTASETLLTIGADPRHLGATLGFFAVLHTWGQNLLHHPHVHCVIAGGGLSPDRQRWIGCRPGFFLPVRVLSRLFRRLFLEALEAAFRQGQLTLPPGSPDWGDYLRPLGEQDWVVYSKPPFGGPAHVLEYLGRYTHRVAIANQRLVAYDGDSVTFHWKDYRHKDQYKSHLLTLSVEEFLRRFLIHTLPDGFQRIRYFGFLANRHRRDNLELCRRLLATTAASLLPSPAACRTLASVVPSAANRCCPLCGTSMIRVDFLPPYRWPLLPPDSS